MPSESFWADDRSEQLELADARARQSKAQLQRCALYSAGSRARLPQMKPKPQSPPPRDSVEPFFGDLGSTSDPYIDRPATAIPPGAHEDTYRVLYPPSASKKITSEKLFWTTTSMTDGIRVMPQPPWYYGYSNKAQPSDSNMLNSASRYGYRGSQSIRQYNRNPYSQPEHTITDLTPEFLRRDTLERQRSPDTWVPSLEARSSLHRQTPLNSPKLWPETSSFVTGYKKKRPATSAWYRKETTATDAETEETMLDSRLHHTWSLLDHERDNFSVSTHLERSGALLSRPHTMASVFWNTTGSPGTTSHGTRMSSHKSKSAPSASPIRGSGAAEQLRYSGTQTIVVQQKPRDQVKYEHQSTQHPLNLHLSLRWQNIFIAHRALSKALKRNLDTRAHVLKLAELMKIQATKRAAPALLNKSQFMRTMDAFGLFHLMTRKQRNWLFAVFDVSKHNIIRYVEVVAMLGLLDTAKESAEATLQWLWELYEVFGRDQSPLENAQTIYLTCCYDDAERKLCLDKFGIIRNECYRHIAIVNVSTGVGSSNAPGEQVAQRDTAVPSAFNICDGTLSFSVFIAALRNHPDCLEFFTSCLNSRLAQYQQYLQSVST